MMLPSSATPDAARLVTARALRGFADGLISVYLAAYLKLLGFPPFEIGAIVTAMLLGSAMLTLVVGLAAPRLNGRQVLFGAGSVPAHTSVGYLSANCRLRTGTGRGAVTQRNVSEDDR